MKAVATGTILRELARLKTSCNPEQLESFGSVEYDQQGREKEQ
jgi:hypothetical protein